MANELIRIVYRPKDDPEGRRHTSWLRWNTAGKPPKDFGTIESVSVVDVAAMKKVKFIKPSRPS